MMDLEHDLLGEGGAREREGSADRGEGTDNAHEFLRKSAAGRLTGAFGRGTGKV